MKMLVRFMLCLMISFTLVELPILKSQAHAGMISTGQVVEEMTRTQDHQKVADFMKREDVKKQMIKMGVTPEEATLRLASLSDKELRKVAGDIDKSVVGGDVTGILVLVLLVVLIIYLVKRI